MSKTKMTIQEEITAIMETMTAKQLQLLYKMVKKLAGVERVLPTRTLRTWEELHNGNDAV